MLADRPRKYLRLTQRDDFLAGRMDGTRSVSDLVVEYFHRFGRFAFDRVASLVGEFRKAGFLTDPPKDIYGALRTRLEGRAPVRARRWVGTPLRLRLPLRGLDPLVTRLHDRVGWIFFTRPVVLGSVALTVLGVAALVAELRGGKDPFAPLGTSHLAGVAALILAYYAAVFVHESAHALTCKHFGGRVDEGGFMLYYLVPAFYVNVTDSWLAPWRRRIAVFWAGPYSGFVLASLSAIAVFMLPGGLLSDVLFKLSVVFYINSAFNLTPLLLLDGYWILEELLETPRLRERALDFVRGPLWRALLDRKSLSGRDVFYAIFGSLCALYSFLAVYLGFLYWGRRLKPVVVPLWRTPGLLAKGVLVLIVGFVAVLLGIRLFRALLGYARALRRAPAATRKAIEAVRIRDRLRLLAGVGFLAKVPRAGRERLARAATARELRAGAVVIRQGERGDEFYIVTQGEVEVLAREQDDDRVLATLAPGDFFGERALLGAGIRTATVRALTPLKLLVFSQRTFWAELAGTVGWNARVRDALEERQRLQALPLFAEAGSRQLDLLAVKLDVRRFAAQETIVREGEAGDAFFLVREGELEVLQGEPEPIRINLIRPGDFFGEIALLHDVPRTATVRACTPGSVWRLARADFRDLLGRYLGLEGQIARVGWSRLARGHSTGGA
jgi:putative peptide zinc metalloprotease protein